MKISLLNKSKKGMSSINQAIGMVFLILIIAVLGPVIFGTDGLANVAFIAAAPAWLITLLTIGAGIALVKLVIKAD